MNGYHWADGHTHDWQEIESMYSNEYKADVRCALCGCPGEKDRENGEVYWPAT